MPAPSSTYAAAGRPVPPAPRVMLATLAPSRYRAWPGMSTAWCQAPSVTAPGELIVVQPPKEPQLPYPCRCPLDATDSSVADPYPIAEVVEPGRNGVRSEEHTSELQSRQYLV